MDKARKLSHCGVCREGAALPFAITTAFQPIFDMRNNGVFAYEALVRGENGEAAGEVLGRVDEKTRYSFDQLCRVNAIKNAVTAGILETDAKLSINFMPNAVYSPLACIQLTLKTAREVGFPQDRLIFEFTEHERLDVPHVTTIVEAYRQLGFATAIDDFGAGFSGLNVLANLGTDIIKLDMELVRGIDTSEPRRQIVRAMTRLCTEMGRTVIAEGVETPGELAAVRSCGIDLVQGFFLARPAVASLPALDMGQDNRLRLAS
ncbi:EAL domain-containing protein [Aurantiacibacter zhengii]|uniref:EAL domain-containing protein n=1 Tax=Aurantiacibacter zhengii TaxID=2307003 RepID=A0A418NWX5_9SPHN|nr:EAL domain-containing protein [Aurantiacibacter zhengii]RIV89141.1 EAL domain-containing protein [Aurantiacibacter zhengii]